jgi:hypothetical protein
MGKNTYDAHQDTPAAACFPEGQRAGPKKRRFRADFQQFSPV